MIESGTDRALNWKSIRGGGFGDGRWPSISWRGSMAGEHLRIVYDLKKEMRLTYRA